MIATTRHAASTSQVDRRAAQLMLTGYLVQGCEQALFELRRSLGEAEHGADVRVGLLAADLMEEVLGSWRDARSALAGRAPE